MKLHVVTGGARAGKSRYAQALAAELGGGAVTFIATATVTDEEMARRIERHRRGRPVGWTTVEAPRNAGRAVTTAGTPVVLLDCLTLLCANAMAGVRDEETALAVTTAETDGLLRAVESRDGVLIVVTNEVGWGIHPATALGRWFRDALGSANQRLATVANEVVLVVAGVPLRLKPPSVSPRQGG